MKYRNVLSFCGLFLTKIQLLKIKAGYKTVGQIKNCEMAFKHNKDNADLTMRDRCNRLNFHRLI